MPHNPTPLRRNGGASARVAASILWVLVIIALAYGVFNTARTRRRALRLSAPAG
jgi:hypothetical protein